MSWDHGMIRIDGEAWHMLKPWEIYRMLFFFEDGTEKIHPAFLDHFTGTISEWVALHHLTPQVPCTYGSTYGPRLGRGFRSVSLYA